MLLHFAPGAEREGYFEGLAEWGPERQAEDEDVAEFYLRHDNLWREVGDCSVPTAQRASRRSPARPPIAGAVRSRRCRRGPCAPPPDRPLGRAPRAHPRRGEAGPRDARHGDPRRRDAPSPAGGRAALNAAGGRVLFPRDVVERAIASAPRSFTLYDRDGNPHADLGGDRVHFVPGLVRPRSGWTIGPARSRLANSTDFVEYVRLADGLQHIAYLATAFSTNDDIEAQVSDAWRLYMTPDQLEEAGRLGRVHGARRRRGWSR